MATENNDTPKIKKANNISKHLSQLGIYSRREAEIVVKSGRVKINGELCGVIDRVDYEDEISIDDEIIANRPKTIQVFLFHKPQDCITGTKDPEGRPSIFDVIPSKLGKLIAVGRLDYKTEGLLILTNDGGFARYMELPSSGMKRTYSVCVVGEVDMEEMKSLENGITIDEIRYDRVIVQLNQKKNAETENDQTWLDVTIFEGKNREIRKIMEHFDLIVHKLIRTSYGPFRLDSIPVGCVVEVKLTKDLYDPETMSVSNGDQEDGGFNDFKSRRNNQDRFSRNQDFEPRRRPSKRKWSDSSEDRGSSHESETENEREEGQNGDRPIRQQRDRGDRPFTRNRNERDQGGFGGDRGPRRFSPRPRSENEGGFGGDRGPRRFSPRPRSENEGGFGGNRGPRRFSPRPRSENEGGFGGDRGPRRFGKKFGGGSGDRFKNRPSSYGLERKRPAGDRFDRDQKREKGGQGGNNKKKTPRDE